MYYSLYWRYWWVYLILKQFTLPSVSYFDGWKNIAQSLMSTQAGNTLRMIWAIVQIVIVSRSSLVVYGCEWFAFVTDRVLWHFGRNPKAINKFHSHTKGVDCSTVSVHQYQLTVCYQALPQGTGLYLTCMLPLCLAAYAKFRISVGRAKPHHVLRSLHPHHFCLPLSWQGTWAGFDPGVYRQSYQQGSSWNRPSLMHVMHAIDTVG